MENLIEVYRAKMLEERKRAEQAERRVAELEAERAYLDKYTVRLGSEVKELNLGDAIAMALNVKEATGQ